MQKAERREDDNVMGKRLIFLILCFVFLLQPAALAKPGDVTGAARYTDIVAYINNRPIPSYSVSGYTVIAAEDLRYYGFSVEWNESDRSLRISRDMTNNNITPVGGVYRYGRYDGLKFADILETDIRTYLSGKSIEGFNIGGTTMIYLNSLSECGIVKWNEEQRAAELILGGISMIEKPFVPEGTIPYEVNPNRPMIALTFDDGPFPEATDRILNVLGRYNSRATFFVTGSNVHAYPETARRLGIEHMQVGNHTYNHVKLTLASDEAVAEEIVAADRATREIIGCGTDIMRPPFWVSDERVRRVAGLPVITWSLDTLDWKNKSADTIYQTVIKKVRDGDIILMHDTMECTAEAVEKMVPVLTDIGFQLVTVDEMAAAKGICIEPGKLYTRLY